MNVLDWLTKWLPTVRTGYYAQTDRELSAYDGLFGSPLAKPPIGSFLSVKHPNVLVLLSFGQDHQNSFHHEATCGETKMPDFPSGWNTAALHAVPQAIIAVVPRRKN